MEDESIMHALVRCGHASALRSAMQECWDLPDEIQLLNLPPESLLPIVVDTGTDRGAKLLLLLWRSWQVRNNITHNSDRLSFAASVTLLQKYWEELCEIQQQHGVNDPKGKKPVVVSLCAGKQKKKCRHPAPWEPPQQDWLKINVVGVIIRNARGEAQLTAWKYVSKCTSAEEMEALACKEGPVLAAACHQCVILETDCEPIAAMLASGTGMRSYLKFIIDEALDTIHARHTK